MPLTDAEIYQMDSTAKDFAIDLIDARVWTKGSDEYRQFCRYAPKDTVRIAVWETDNRRFSNTLVTEMTGAEYRRALVTARAIASYARLDADAQARINQEIYGQATTPERGTAAHNRGRDNIARIAGIVGGEGHARPAEPSRPTTGSTEPPKRDSTKDTKPGGGGRSASYSPSAFATNDVMALTDELEASFTSIRDAGLDPRIMAQVSGMGSVLNDPALWESSDPSDKTRTRRSRAGVAA